MSRNVKNIFWGLFFIVAAVLVVVGNRMSHDISAWTIFFTVILAAALIKSILKIKWGGIFFSLAFLAIVYDDMLHIEDLTPWPVLGAALLLTIGFNLIYHKSHFLGNCTVNGKPIKKGEIVDEVTEDDESYYCETVFGTTVKYVNSKNLSKAHLENTFGSLTVYFDNALLMNGRANFYVENTFGKTVVYIPKEWHVIMRKEQAFGTINEIGKCAFESDNVVEAHIETTFGMIEINYI